MEYVLLIVVLIQSGFISYLLNKSKQPKIEVKPEVSAIEKEITRQENIDKSFQKLFNYNEDIATRGYKE